MSEEELPDGPDTTEDEEQTEEEKAEIAFDKWYDSASRDELAEALKPEKLRSFQDQFLDSEAFTEAEAEFIRDQAESGAEPDWFKPEAYLG